MIGRWTVWKRLPAAALDVPLDAPEGPGVYEVRSATSGELIAFGHSPNVASILSTWGSGSFWKRLLRRMPIHAQPLEYRTIAAATPRVARDHAFVLDQRRRAFWNHLARPA